MKKIAFLGLRPIILVATLFFFANSLATAQGPWYSGNSWAPGAQEALYQYWGEQMGYTSQRSLVMADSIFNAGKSTAPVVEIQNSGVSPDGRIHWGKNGRFKAVLLGDVRQDGVKLHLYMKVDGNCHNLGRVQVLEATCTPPSNVRISGQSLGGGQVRLTATWTAGSNGGTETVTWMVGATTVGTGATATFTPPAGATTTYTATVRNTCGQASANHQVVVAAPAAPTGTTTSPAAPTRPAATATQLKNWVPAGQYAQLAQPVPCQPVFWGSNQVPCWRDPVFGVFFSFNFVFGWQKCHSRRHNCDYYCPTPPPPTWSCPAPPPPGRVPVVMDHGNGDGTTGDPVAGTDSGDGDGNGSGETGEPWDPTDPDPGDGTGETGDPWPGGDTGGGDLVAPIPPAAFEPAPQAAYQVVDGGYSPNPPVGMRRVNFGGGTPMATYAPMSGEGVNSPNPAYQPFPQGTAGGDFPYGNPGYPTYGGGTNGGGSSTNGTYTGPRTHGTQVGTATPGSGPGPRHGGTSVTNGGGGGNMPPRTNPPRG